MGGACRFELALGPVFSNTVEIVIRADSAQFDRAVNRAKSRFKGAIGVMHKSATQGTTSINQAFAKLRIRSTGQINREISEVSLALPFTHKLVLIECFH